MHVITTVKATLHHMTLELLQLPFDPIFPYRITLYHLALSWARTLGSISCACIEAARVSGCWSMVQAHVWPHCRLPQQGILCCSLFPRLDPNASCASGTRQSTRQHKDCCQIATVSSDVCTAGLRQPILSSADYYNALDRDFKESRRKPTAWLAVMT